MPKKINVDKEQLEELYIRQNKSRKETAELLGIKESLIKVKIAKYKIKKSSEAHVENIKKTCLERYGVTNAGGIPSTLEKIKASNRKKFGYDWCVQSPIIKEKVAEKFKKEGITNVFQRESVKHKIQQTCIKRYGVKFNMQCKEVVLKGIKTKRINHTFNTSKPEQEILKLLRQKFKDVQYQYTSEKYSFACDVYIPQRDLYIEYQGTWTHGKKPFEGTKEDLQKIELWKSKNTKFYKTAINVWTVRDPLKRETAKKNNLNWIEFFNIDQFMEWYNSL